MLVVVAGQQLPMVKEMGRVKRRADDVGDAYSDGAGPPRAGRGQRREAWSRGWMRSCGHHVAGHSG